MAVEKQNPETTDILEEEIQDSPEGVRPEVDVEVEGEEEVVEERPQDDFNANLAESMDERTLKEMGSDLVEEYKKDRTSRKEWEDAYIKGLDLLGTRYQEVTKPFKGASGVTHPLLAEAVTQFQAQAYKELVPSDGPVRTQVIGLQTPATEQQADRVKDYMNYLLMEEMEDYTTDMDQMLFYLPLSGSTFKKIYFDALQDRPVSKFIPAEDLVVPYYASDLKDCERITHVIKMTENEVTKKMAAGFYRDIDLIDSSTEPDSIQKKLNELEGVKGTGADYLNTILEMHVDLNLDDFEDFDDKAKKIKIPYIVTVDEGSGEVLSIYRNYKPDDPTYSRTEYFVHYKFLPGLGFYGFGLTHMIGGLSQAATQALRQLIDAGTLKNLPAGFKARGIRVRDDDQPIQPGEFRDVDAPGGNIRDQFFNLPFTEPSPTLYNLMGFVVQAGQKFAAITDSGVGNDTQNRAVGTTMALMERGSRVMSGVHKRCYYAMRLEFKILARICGESLPPEYPYDVYGGPRNIKQTDFDRRVDILPVADPNIMSMAQRVTLAQAQLQIAQSNPEMHNLHEAYRRVYEALGTKTIDQILKPPAKQPEPLDPAKENARALQMKLLTAFEFQEHDAHLAAHMAFMQSRMVQINPQVYALLQSHISDHVSFKAKAQVKAMIMQNPEMAQMAQQDPQQFEIMFEAEVAKVAAQITQELVQSEQASQNKEDPLIKIKQQEIDLRAMDLQRKAEETKFRADQENQRAAQRLEFDYDRLSQQDEQSDERLEVAREKMNKK
jgi:chaperonin GroES